MNALIEAITWTASDVSRVIAVLGGGWIWLMAIHLRSKFRLRRDDQWYAFQLKSDAQRFAFLRDREQRRSADYRAANHQISDTALLFGKSGVEVAGEVQIRLLNAAHGDPPCAGTEPRPPGHD